MPKKDCSKVWEVLTTIIMISLMTQQIIIRCLLGIFAYININITKTAAAFRDNRHCLVPHTDMSVANYSNNINQTRALFPV